MDHLWLKAIHILSANLMLGSSVGIGFFMSMADRTRDARIVAAVGRAVFLADALIVAPAVVGLLVTGPLLADSLGLSLWRGWLGLAMGLLAVSGLCWLPGIWLQKRAWRLAACAAAANAQLPPRYFRLMRVWYWLGVPSTAAILAILALMVLRPAP